MRAGWQTCPTWSALLDGVRPPPADYAGPGDWPHGWQMRATRTLNTHFRERTLLPDMPPSSQALLRSQAGPQAGAWLAAIPTEPATTLPPMAMQIALRRRLRQPLPLHSNTCGPPHGCRGAVDRFGDHALACPRTGLLARRAKIVERAWVQVAREAVGSEGQVVPQQWLANTTAPQVGAQDRRRLDLVVYGALRSGGAQCCDATLVSPFTRSGHPQPCAAAVDGAVLRVAERHKHAAYPELTRGGPQTLVVLGSEVGGRWNAQARGFVRDLVRLKAYRAPSPCARQRQQLGRGAGGACFRSRCSRQSPVRLLEVPGGSRCNLRLAKARRSTASSTTLPLRATVACPCGRSEGTPSSWRKKVRKKTQNFLHSDCMHLDKWMYIYGCIMLHTHFVCCTCIVDVHALELHGIRVC